MEESIIAVLSGAFIVAIVGWSTHSRPSLASAIANGAMIIMTGGTLLYANKLLGYLLLLYGVFLLIVGMKELEAKRLKGTTDYLGVIVKYAGNYITAVVIILLITWISYGIWPF